VTASNDYRYDSAGAPRDRSLRVGDKERDGVSEILRQAHVEGRLDDDEFQERIERCLTAKSYADLDRLIADVPRQRTDTRASSQRWGSRPWPVPFVFIPLALIAAVVIGGHVAWLAFPLIIFFVVRPLMWRAWGGGSTRGSWARGPRRITRPL